MSGIVALLGTDGQPIEPSLLDAMVGALAFRGPDGSGAWLDGWTGEIGLGHTWLDVGLDGAPGRRAPLSGGPQPLTLDGEVWLTADARIDGQAELRADLASRGQVVAADASDAALILHAYDAWGVDCARYLIGDFAFVLWDRRARRLLAARDHFGVKPLFYACREGWLVVSNTLDVLRFHPAVTAVLDELSIADLLLFGCNLDVERTAFADIRRLPPAHVMAWEDGRVAIRRYWSLPQELAVYGRRPADMVEGVLEQFDRAVADRLRVPRVSVFMSGGLDSSAIAATAARQLSPRPPAETVRAVTLVYDRLIPDEERHWSGLAAAHIGISVDYFAADDYLLFDPAHVDAAHWPEPYDRSMAIMDDMMFDAAAAHSRVVLTGYGGDPVQYPEPAYVPRLMRGLRFGRLAADLAATVQVNRRLPPLYLRSGAGRWWQDRRGALPEAPPLPEWINPDLARRLNLDDRWRHWHQTVPEHDHGHPNRPLAAYHLDQPLWPSTFDNYDAGATGRPMEARHPFFDLRLIAFMLRVPPLPWCINKTLLRQAMRGRLPESVRWRPKAPLAGLPHHPLVPELQPLCLRAAQTRAFARVAPDGSLLSSSTDNLAALAPLISLDRWFGQALQPSLNRNGATHHDRAYPAIPGGPRFQRDPFYEANLSIA
jgi:asparagine synthase (glutamine-hydrolysing)